MHLAQFGAAAAAARTGRDRATDANEEGEIAMRTMLRVTMPADAGNRAIKDGTCSKVIEGVDREAEAGGQLFRRQ